MIIHLKNYKLQFQVEKYNICNGDVCIGYVLILEENQGLFLLGTKKIKKIKITNFLKNYINNYLEDNYLVKEG